MAVYTVTTATELTNRINGTGGVTAAKYGDVVRVNATGTLTTSATLAPAAGVTVVGPGAGVATVLSKWSINTSGSPWPVVLRDLKLNVTALSVVSSYAPIEVRDSQFYMLDSEVVGPGAALSDLVSFAAITYPCVGKMARCKIHGAAADCVSTKAPGGVSSLSAASRLDLALCEVYTPGSSSSDQCLTAHDGFPIYDYFGYYHGANGGGTIIPDTIAASPIYLYGTRIDHEGANGAALECTEARGIEVLQLGSTADTQVNVLSLIEDSVITGASGAFLRLTVPLTMATTGTVKMLRNRLRFAAIYFNQTIASADVDDNLIADTTTTNYGGVWLHTAAAGTYRVQRNTARNCYSNFRFRGEAGASILFRDNLSMDPVAHAVFSFGSPTYDAAGGYNQIAGTNSGYSTTTGDTTAEPTGHEIQGATIPARQAGRWKYAAMAEDVARKIELAAATLAGANITYINGSAATAGTSPGGSGADSVTLTITVSGLPVADADVWITSDLAGSTVVAGTLQTDSNGEVTFLLDAGSTYFLWWQHDGYESIQGQSFVAVAD